MTTIDPETRQTLRQENLRYTQDDKPGFFRQKMGAKFAYYDTDGQRIKDKEVVERIDSLAIPPAWKNVWISPHDNGHIQATGLDDKKRKQYIYHPDWIARCQQNKFEKMVDFGLKLPKIRGKIKYSLKEDNLNKQNILATVIWLLEKTFIRIGNEEYTRDNKSFGLTTLRNRHVKVWGDNITFRFRGKSGVDNFIEISNPSVARTIKKCIELPGYELFKFIDDDGEKHIIDSQDVNEFLQDITNNDFTAKDFRTWGATNLSALNLYKLGKTENKEEIKKNIKKTIKEVAKQLNNTVAVCKSYYIHPTVINAYTKNTLVEHFDKYAKSKAKRKGLYWHEYALIKLLEDHPYKAA